MWNNSLPYHSLAFGDFFSNILKVEARWAFYFLCAATIAHDLLGQNRCILPIPEELIFGGIPVIYFLSTKDPDLLLTTPASLLIAFPREEAWVNGIMWDHTNFSFYLDAASWKLYPKRRVANFVKVATMMECLKLMSGFQYIASGLFNLEA